MNDASVVKTIVDICSRSFKIVSDEGYIQLVQCESAEEFMDVLQVVNDFLDDDMLVSVSYTHLTLPKTTYV